MWRELINDFLQDLNAQRTRSFLTILAMTWGTVAVVLLLSFGEGLGTQMLNGLMNAGNQIMILYGGETGMQFEGVPKGRRIRLVEEDATLLLKAIPSIAQITPQYRADSASDRREELDEYGVRGGGCEFRRDAPDVSGRRWPLPERTGRRGTAARACPRQ